MYYRVADFYLFVSEEPSNWHMKMVQYLDYQCSFLKREGGVPGAAKTIELRHYEFDTRRLSVVNCSPKEHLLTDQGIYINLERKIGFKIADEKMIIWCEKPALNLPFMLQLFFTRHNCTFAHGAAFHINGRNIFISALSAIGKTALASKVLSTNGNLLYGDDFVVLDGDGNINPFPQSLCLYEYHQKYFPDFFKKNRLGLYFRAGEGFIGKIRRRIMKCSWTPYRAYNPDVIFGSNSIATAARRCDKLFLMKKSSVQRLTISKIKKEEFINFTVTVAHNEWTSGNTLKFLLGYCAVQNLSIGRYFDGVRKIVTGFVNNCASKSIAQIEVPYIFDESKDVYEDLYDFLRGVGA